MTARDDQFALPEQWSSFDGLTEFQEICKFCYNFNSMCECVDRSASANVNAYENNSFNTESEEDIESLSFAQTEELKNVQLIVYTTPSILDTTRRDVDTEEYNLKARFLTTIPAKESRSVLTNLIILNKGDCRNGSRKLQIQNRIQSGWLSETYNSMLVLKTGTISPLLSGDLYVNIYNRTEREIIVAKGSPIGILQSQHYEYS